jgi:hypothetical protein
LLFPSGTGWRRGRRPLLLSLGTHARCVPDSSRCCTFAGSQASPAVNTEEQEHVAQGTDPRRSRA